MTGRQITAVVIAAVATFAIAYDVWVCANYGSASTISWVTWTTAQHYPVIPFAAGVIAGHLFWVQQTGRPFPSPENPKCGGGKCGRP